MTRLWESTPQKLPHVGPSTNPSPRGSGNNMADVLDEMLTTPSKRRSISPPSSASQATLQRNNINNRYGSLGVHNESSYSRNTRQIQEDFRTPPMALKSLSLGDYPAKSTQAQAISNVGDNQDVMDWSFLVRPQSKLNQELCGFMCLQLLYLQLIDFGIHQTSRGCVYRLRKPSRTSSAMFHLNPMTPAILLKVKPKLK
jgi:hypothetical protein